MRRENLPKIVLGLLLTFFFSAATSAQQIISYEKIASFSIDSLNSILVDVGVPNGVIEVKYPIDAYKVLYKSPYIHPDSMVQASGAILVPRTEGCELPMAAYMHGTQARRSTVPSSLNGGQIEVAMIFAATGYVLAVPDYLGLGDSDPRVIVHPYTHSYSQAYTCINIMRSAREMAPQEGFALNDQIFMFGYSQGGGATAAAHRAIEAFHTDEFQITASAPMSGAYDLKEAQVDLIASDEVYPTPGYLPYIILAYESVYGNLFDDPSDIFVAPYDSLMPALFYSGEYSIGYINGQSTPVPKDMVKDSVIQAFFDNADHPLRLALDDNHLIDGWHPKAPMKLYYCKGDDQVTYLNSENAYNQWIESGSTQLEKRDFGAAFDHNDCALFCFLDARLYFNSFADLTDCFAVGVESIEPMLDVTVYPNPSRETLFIDAKVGDYTVRIFNLLGELVATQNNVTTMDIGHLPQGTYIYQVANGSNIMKNDKLIILD